jgi:hypothetical protein
MNKIIWASVVVLLIAYFGVTTIIYMFCEDYSRACLHAIMFLINYINLKDTNGNEYE